MLALLSEYVKNIVLLVVFMAFAGIILPDGRYKGYISVVLGLVLIFVMLTPVAGWFSGGGEVIPGGIAGRLSPEGGAFSSETLPEGLDSDTQAAMLDKSFTSMLKKQVGGIIAPEGFTLSAFDVSYDRQSGEIRLMTLAVERKTEGDAPYRLIKIEPVTVRTAPGEPPPEGAAPEVKKLKNILSGFYNLAEDNIYITVRNDGTQTALKKSRGDD